MEVRKESRVKVTPSVPTPKTKLKLSFLDHIQPPIYVGIIFYYKDNNDPDIHEKLVKLEKSLSDSLVHFYPFAGRYLQEGGCSFVDCGDQGVEYVVAKVDGHLDQLLENEVDQDTLANLTSFPTELENGNPIIVIQVNMFKCGGLAIGVQFFHKLPDMFTICMFMSAWSMACRDGTTPVIPNPPSFDLGSLIPQKEIGESTVGGTKKTHPRLSDVPYKKLVLKTFTFHNDVISKLKAGITTSTSTSLQASRVEVVSAVISKAIVEIKSSKKCVNSKPFVIVHSMNLRGKTNLHIAENLCGNFFTTVVTPPRNSEQAGITTLSILDLICGAMRKAKSQFSMATAADLCSLVEKYGEEHVDAMKKTVSGEITYIPFASQCKFPLYEVNFGWGNPDLVSIAPKRIEYIVLIDSKWNDGIEAWVTLDIDDMLLLNHKLDTILRI